jgi:hypothetical protein
VAARRGIGQVDRDLGVLYPARGSGVLALHAGGGGPLLDIPGLIDHEHRAGVAQMLDDVAAYVIAHPVGIPARPRQKVLHAARRRVPGMLGDGPAVLPGQAGQQPRHERPRPAPRLHPAETMPDTQHYVIQDARPALRVYAVASGHRTIIMSRHKP